MCPSRAPAALKIAALKIKDSPRHSARLRPRGDPLIEAELIHKENAARKWLLGKPRLQRVLKKSVLLEGTALAVPEAPHF
jgi:hypothetical protein